MIRIRMGSNMRSESARIHVSLGCSYQGELAYREVASDVIGLSMMLLLVPRSVLLNGLKISTAYIPIALCYSIFVIARHSP